MSPSENATERAAHDRSSNTLAGRAADRLAQVSGNLARDLVGHRPRHLPGNRLRRRQSCSTRPIGPVKAAEETSDRASDCRENAAALRLYALAGTGRSSSSGHGASLQTPLQDFVGRFRINGLVVLALQRTPIRADGGRTRMRLTIEGVPSPSRNDTSASPLPSWVMTWAVFSLGLGRKVSAAAATAF